MAANPVIQRLLRGELKATATYAGIQVATRFGGYLALPFYWVKLGPADFGIIATAEMMTTFFAGALNLSLEQSVTRCYLEWDEKDRPRKLGAIWLANWLAVFGLGALLILLGRFFLPLLFPGVDYYPYLALGSVIAMATSLTALPFATLRIRQEPARYGKYSLGKFVLQTGLTLFLVLGLNMGVFGYLLGMAIGTALLALWAALMLKPIAVINWDWKTIREAIGFSAPLIPAQVMNAATATLDRVLLSRFGSLEMLGVYSVALKFAGIVSAVHEMLKLSYGPFIYKTMEDHRDNAFRLIARVLPWYLAAILVTGLGVALFIDEFVLISGSPAYAAINPYVPWLAVAAVAPTMNIYFAPGAVLSKKTKWLLIPSMIQLGVMCAAGPLLIPGHGIMGVIAAKAMAVGAYLAVNIWISVRLEKRWIYRWNVFLSYASIMLMGAFLAVWSLHLGPRDNAILSVSAWTGAALGLFFYLRWQTHAEPRELQPATS